MQFSQSSSTIVEVGNATIGLANLEASNGILHVIQSFPCTDTAFNNTMIATLELAGDFGPFSDAKVGLATFLPRSMKPAITFWM